MKTKFYIVLIFITSIFNFSYPLFLYRYFCTINYTLAPRAWASRKKIKLDTRSKFLLLLLYKHERRI